MLYMDFKEIYFLEVYMTCEIHAEDEDTHFCKSPDLKENLGEAKVVLARNCMSYAERGLYFRGKEAYL